MTQKDDGQTSLLYEVPGLNLGKKYTLKQSQNFELEKVEGNCLNLRKIKEKQESSIKQHFLKTLNNGNILFKTCYRKGSRGSSKIGENRNGEKGPR